MSRSASRHRWNALIMCLLVITLSDVARLRVDLFQNSGRLFFSSFTQQFSSLTSWGTAMTLRGCPQDLGWLEAGRGLLSSRIKCCLKLR
jgi:hypothetical protein